MTVTATEAETETEINRDICTYMHICTYTQRHKESQRQGATWQHMIARKTVLCY